MNKARVACVTLDLEQDYGGRTGTLEAFEHLEALDRVRDLLEHYQVTPTAFVVGKLLEGSSPSVERVISRMAELYAEFEVHTYSHPLREVDDPRREMELGYDAYTRYFGRAPLGYRAAMGRMKRSTLPLLAELGYRFDSSICPTYRPGAYSNLDQSYEPYALSVAGLVEIPMSVIGNIRIPLGLGYVKLLGFGLFRRLVAAFGLPNSLSFGFHLHDVIPLKVFGQLPGVQKLKWRRGRSTGMDTLEACLELFQNMGYAFAPMSNVVDHVLQAEGRRADG